MAMAERNVVILGGGFAGLYTALELLRLPNAAASHITLVDRQDRFLFAPLLYEYLTGEMEEWEIAPPLRSLLPPPSTVLQDHVTQIDLNHRQIHLAQGSPLSYDALVIALGGETPDFGIPGVAEHAYFFRTLADARRLYQRLQLISSRTQIRIVGGGPSGVELACKLADRLGSLGEIHLIDRGSQILSGFSGATVRAAEQALARRQIPVHLGRQVTAVGKDYLQWQAGQELRQEPVDLVIWVAGLGVNPQVQALDLPKNPRGQLHVTPTLQVPDHPDVFALGDAASLVDADGKPVPASAQAAFQQAGYAAWNLWASLDPHPFRPLLPFRYQPLGEMLSLGSDTAVLSGLGLTLSGSLGYLARRLVYLGRMPTWEHQLKLGWQWIRRPLTFLRENLS